MIEAKGPEQCFERGALIEELVVEGREFHSAVLMTMALVIGHFIEVTIISS